ncbi:MAG: sodium/proline symporter [Gammaproteobacteria bacterium]|nr:sodium/proline symporter [Gammaproteobacteria bacterium]
MGLWASRRIRDETDFLLGGRKLGAWVAGLSYAASTSSAWALLGFSGFMFTYGVAALWMLPGIWGGYVLVWLWFGPLLGRESRERRWVTPTDFLCANVATAERARIAALATLLIAFCFIFYIAAQFDAAATAFTTNFAMGKAASLLLSAGIILIYCLLGGFWAASVTDTLQGLVMMLAAILVPVFAVIAAGGPAEILAGLDQAEPAFRDWSGGYVGFTLTGFVLGMAGVGLGACGQPQLLARLMAVRGERERKRGFMIAITWAVIVYVGMSWLALSARSLALAPDTGEQIFYLLADSLLPPVLAGIVIASILSAVMSTVDSLLLAASAAVAHDLGLAQRTKRGEVWISRIVMTLIVVAAVVLALSLPDTIFNRVLFAWSALGAAFGPLVIARVMRREPPAAARFWSIATGFGLTVAFYVLGTFAPAEAGNAAMAVLIDLATMPGDPFERAIPFVPPLLILFLWPGSLRPVA